MSKASTPPERSLLHTRTVDCCGYLRPDGHFDIEARIVDRKNYAATMIDGRQLEVGEPWHEMTFRLCVDRSFVIHEAEARTVHGPIPACGEIAETYEQLVGLSIGPGFGSAVRQKFAGAAGCTHITELLGPLATTAYQTISGYHLASNKAGGWDSPDVRKMAVHLVDSCHVWRRDGDTVAQHYPELLRRED